MDAADGLREENKLPDDIWGEIGQYLAQPEFLQSLSALALTSKQLYGDFGGYRFVSDQSTLDKALTLEGEAKAIVLTSSDLRVNQVPVCHTPEGLPTPVVSYGSDTAVTSGNVQVRNATVTASGDAVVYAHEGSTIFASGKAVVYGDPGSTVTGSDDAKVDTYSTAIVSGNVRVIARAGSTVTGQGSGVVIFAGAGSEVQAEHPDTLRLVDESFRSLQLRFLEQLEAKYPPPSPPQ